MVILRASEQALHLRLLDAKFSNAREDEHRKIAERIANPHYQEQVQARRGSAVKRNSARTVG